MLCGGVGDSENLFEKIRKKRTDTKCSVFEKIHPQIVPMLEKLKGQGIKVGLISNCFSEEAEVIEKSFLYKYFDSVCLSYREGVQKPEPEIFIRCLTRLELEAVDCLYVGDGGSCELEAASDLGMEAVQACWYLKAENPYMQKPKPGYFHAKNPMEIFEKAVS